MVLYCGECAEGVLCGAGTVDSWHGHLWDHLLDEHLALVAAGSWSSVQFSGPNGLRVYVDERAGASDA